jgi:fructose-bisphosphate aldolase class II
VASFRSEGSPVFLNADHSYSFDSVKEAVDAGFDSVIFDGAKLSFEENVKITKECVKYARACGRNVLVEGELGFIGTSSQILKKIPDGVKISHEYLTKPEDAHRFVKETEVDLIAPAVGNIHGMLSPHRRPAEEAEWVGDPPLDVSRIAAIRESAGVPVVLHGASGNSAEDIRAAVVSGASIVHWNTELRAAYRTGIMRGLEENPDELAPYKYLKEPLLAVEKVVEEKIKLL